MISDLYVFPSLPSTNRHALELARNNAAHGTTLIAFEQTNGHGQYERAWDSPMGSLSLSCILVNPKSPLPQLTIEIGEKICSFLCGLTGKSEFSMKAPNDILYQDKKLCGILIEAVTRGDCVRAVVGIGLDVNNKWQDSFCLREIAGKELDVLEIGKKIAELVVD